MAVTYEIDIARRLVLASVTGVVSLSEMLAYQATVAADPRFLPTFDSLTDFTDAAPFAPPPAAIRRLAGESPYAAGVKRAFVVSSDLHFGLARMSQVFAEGSGIEIGVFRNRTEALAWLGRTP